MPRPTLSLVLPVYNEEEVLPILHDRLQAFLGKLGVDTEVVFVNDGSTDRSLALLRGLVGKDLRYKIVSFSRNFGHGNAITAGIDYARGHAVVIMDADLQDPPEIIVQMLEKWREGHDVVYGQRLKREGETKFKLFTARWFYRMLRALVPIDVPLDTGDFRLMSRQVVVTLRALRETHRFVRGIVAWIGFKQCAVYYDRPGRAAGETKYPLRKMLRLALDAITSFSVVPLRFATYLGMLISAGSVLVALWAVVMKYIMNDVVPGWTATVVLVSLLSSVQLLMIGILGEYVGRIYEQVKGRPLYLVAETVNLAREIDTDELEPAPAFMLPKAPPTPLFPPISQPPPAPGFAAAPIPTAPLAPISAPPPAPNPFSAPAPPQPISVPPPAPHPISVPPPMGPAGTILGTQLGTAAFGLAPSAPAPGSMPPPDPASSPPRSVPPSLSRPNTSRGIPPSPPRSVPPPAPVADETLAAPRSVPPPPQLPSADGPSSAPRSVRPPLPARAAGAPASVRPPRSYAPPVPAARPRPAAMKHTLIGVTPKADGAEAREPSNPDDTQPLVHPPSRDLE